MPWYLRIADIAFWILQFVLLLVAIQYIQPVGVTGAIGFCILYVLFLYTTMAIVIALLPHRYQKYFLDWSPDNPDGTRDIFKWSADTYKLIRNKLK
jgi:hypothetical protein